MFLFHFDIAETVSDFQSRWESLRRERMGRIRITQPRRDERIGLVGEEYIREAIRDHASEIRSG